MKVKHKVGVTRVGQQKSHRPVVGAILASDCVYFVTFLGLAGVKQTQSKSEPVSWNLGCCKPAGCNVAG